MFLNKKEERQFRIKTIVPIWQMLILLIQDLWFQKVSFKMNQKIRLINEYWHL